MLVERQDKVKQKNNSRSQMTKSSDKNAKVAIIQSSTKKDKTLRKGK